jgi:hypothetical protein
VNGLCGKGDATLQQKESDLIDQCRAPLHQSIPNPVHGLHIRRPTGSRRGHHHSAIAELERNPIIERVRAGMRRAKLEGIRIGRRPAEVDRQSVLRDIGLAVAA